MKAQFNLKKDDKELRVRIDFECLTLGDKFYRIEFSKEQMIQEGINKLFAFYQYQLNQEFYIPIQDVQFFMVWERENIFKKIKNFINDRI